MFHIKDCQHIDNLCYKDFKIWSFLYEFHNSYAFKTLKFLKS